MTIAEHQINKDMAWEKPLFNDSFGCMCCFEQTTVLLTTVNNGLQNFSLMGAIAVLLATMVFLLSGMSDGRTSLLGGRGEMMG